MPSLTIRLTAEELSAIRRRARGYGTVSRYARAALLPAATQSAAKPRIVRDKKTGYAVLVSPPGTPVLTSGRVKELLADFP